MLKYRQFSCELRIMLYSLSVEGAVSEPIAFGTLDGASIDGQILHHMNTFDESLQRQLDLHVDCSKNLCQSENPACKK